METMGKNLLQRLLLPPGSTVFNGIGTFKGVSIEIRDYLLTICNFDHMGATEYEWGEIPKSLNEISKSRNETIYTEKEISGVKLIFLVGKTKSEAYFKKVESWMDENHDALNFYHGLCDLKRSGYTNKNELTGWLDISENVLFFVADEEGKTMSLKFKELLCPDLE